CDSWQSRTSPKMGCAASPGRNSRYPMLPSLTSYLPSVTTPPARSAQYGRVSRLPAIGRYRIQQRSLGARAKFSALIVRLSSCWTAESAFFLSLPFARLNRPALKQKLDDIGRQ